MPKLTTLLTPEVVKPWTTDHKPSPQLMADIRAGISNLDRLGATRVADWWSYELHHVSGYPNLKRWTVGALALIERDVMQAELEASC